MSAQRKPAAVFTVALVAERWGTSPTFVYDLIRAGRLSAFRLGGKLIRIRPEDVEEFECRNLGASDRSPESEPMEAAIAPGASNGLTAMDRTASRLERRIEQPLRPQLVYSGPGEPSPPPAQSAR